MKKPTFLRYDVICNSRSSMLTAVENEASVPLEIKRTKQEEEKNLDTNTFK